MLEGITILNEYPLMEFQINVPAGIIAACIVGIAICAFFIHIEVPWEMPSILCVAIICALGFTMVGMLAGKEVPTSAKEYQVTIEDDVSINDVYDYYEIVDKEGDIWTIRKIIDQQ